MFNSNSRLCRLMLLVKLRKFCGKTEVFDHFFIFPVSPSPSLPYFFLLIDCLKIRIMRFSFLFFDHPICTSMLVITGIFFPAVIFL